MISEEILIRIEEEMDQGENVDHCDVRDLVSEVRQLQTELEEARRGRYRIAADIFDERTRACKHADALQGAINRYCETRNNVVADCGPCSDAIIELYRLSRESGFRPRVRASSEVER